MASKTSFLDQFRPFLQTFQELHTASDRAAAIVGAAFVENELKAALIRSFHEDEKITAELFKVTGPLGTFSAKIQLGRLTGLYGPEFYRDLVTIKDIRNRFAHDVEVTSFNKQQIASWCSNLRVFQDWFEFVRTTGGSAETPRRRFEVAVIGALTLLRARTAMLMPQPTI